MKIVRHVMIIVLSLFLIIGIPLICNAERIKNLIKKKNDAVSSATTVMQEKPSGRYFVLINKKLHTGTLDKWKAFFKGEAADDIFEDIECTVIETDITGLETAEHYIARLPENQMSLVTENSMLAMSKLQWGKCDIFILSAEAAGVYHLETIDESVMERISL